MKYSNLINPGRICFGIATMAFGVQHIFYGDFIMGRAPSWPEGLPGQQIWAYFSGGLLIVLGLAITLGKKARPASILVTILVLVWALLRHVIAGNFEWGTELTWFGKALALTGGSLAVTGSLPKESGNRWSIVNQTVVFTLIGRYSLGIFMIICGIEHFMFVEFVKTLVPAWIPGNVFWTYFAGVALIAGGIGLLLNQTVKIAALLSGLMVFIWLIILHVPRAVASMGDGNEWIAVAEALAVSGIAFVLAGTSRIEKPNAM